MPKGYEDYMQKAHGALILERENDIIVELRATREYLKQMIDTNHEELSVRFDAVDKRFDAMETRFDRLEELLQKVLAK